ncbi:DUF4381 domain-containing protein [Algibacillus agarilyticus]|uniref:DUF4381 domain-containing protein n=1 Tax=Algibacillus agarilyticus TaxID=2234133 RepID=UPI000DD004FF|nr:DUF4381 domain-containing protein [Algibacillus agarilyticus]
MLTRFLLMNAISPQLTAATNSPHAPQPHGQGMQLPNDPMAAFKDVALPEPTSTLPAIGWWILGGIIIVSLIVCLKLIWTHYKNSQARREAIQAVNAASSASELNRILKQATLAYFPREDVAALTGVTWYQFLSRHIKKNKAERVCPALKLMIEQLYQPNAQQLSSGQLTQFKTASANWLQLALPPKKINQKAEVKHV